VSEKALQAGKADTLGVGSGSGKSRYKGSTEKPGSDVVMQNTKAVSPINNNRKHPDPTLAATIATMSFSGFTMAQVCSSLRISESTVREYYDYEFKNGQSNMVNDIAQSLAQRAKAGSDTAAIFLLKTRGAGKFTERNGVELTGKDGGPIEIAQRTEILQTVNGLLSKGITIDAEVEPLD
jgi:hypothetical protein